MVKKAPIYKLSHFKAPGPQQIFHYRHARYSSKRFLLYYTGVDFSSGNDFDNLCSFTIVSVPVQSVIPCTKTLYVEELLLQNKIYKITLNYVK